MLAVVAADREFLENTRTKTKMMLHGGKGDSGCWQY